ncbi:MAG: response regulator transcription factor [Deltaproteobacteria bacterium]|nr:response regulator transcription factor [Deltaproteobacteria bacterium]
MVIVEDVLVAAPLRELMGLLVECRTPEEHDEARLAWLERTIGFDTFYFGAAAPERPAEPVVAGVAQEYVSHCEAQADRYWPDRMRINRLAVAQGGVLSDTEVLTARDRDRMPFYREIVGGLGIRAIAAAIVRVRGESDSALYLGRTSRGARFGKELALLRAALPILGLAAAQFTKPKTRTIVDRWSLTPRERQVLEAMGRGLRNAEIATALGTSPRTVKNQVAAILAKAGVSNRSELLAALHGVI